VGGVRLREKGVIKEWYIKYLLYDYLIIKHILNKNNWTFYLFNLTLTFDLNLSVYTYYTYLIK